ncbi:hypothetical protein OH77DRAFT_313867 [Trametes cingulata]|nr:hypothetical protein OH77DRAFT_313867 [Trametes cingulata]
MEMEFIRDRNMISNLEMICASIPAGSGNGFVRGRSAHVLPPPISPSKGAAFVHRRFKFSAGTSAGECLTVHGSAARSVMIRHECVAPIPSRYPGFQSVCRSLHQLLTRTKPFNLRELLVVLPTIGSGYLPIEPDECSTLLIACPTSPPVEPTSRRLTAGWNQLVR